MEATEAVVSPGAALVTEDRKAPGKTAGKEVCLFLADYAVALLGSGATCLRLEKNITRMADVYGKRVEMTIMPRHIHLTVWEPGKDDIFTSTSSVREAPISYTLNTRLSELSWKVADTRMPLEGAIRRFNHIMEVERDYPWTVLLLASLANASFCGIFGGDMIAMLIVFMATALGFNLKQLLLRHKTDLRLTLVICAFLSSVVAACGNIFPSGETPDIAVATSVLYLVPGIPFLNSFNDLLNRHYICAMVRFVDASVLMGCISLGLLLGLRVMQIQMF